MKKYLLVVGVMVVLCFALGGCFAPPIVNSEEPEARFTWTLNDLDERTVTFDGSISSYMDDDSALWCWDFGDGNHESGETITHTYANSGTYPVTLIVINGSGLRDEITKGVVIPKEIVIPDTLPIASFVYTFSLFPVQSGSLVIFDGRESYDPDGWIVSCEWDFDDGEPIEGPWANMSMRVVDHTYQETGTFDVCLTVWDNEGNEGSITNEVMVQAIE